MTDKNIWYLPGPFHRYEDDVKAIAKKSGLRIIDANVTDSREGECEKPPKVKLKELPVVVVADAGLSQDEIEQLRADLAAAGVLVTGLEAGTLERPEGGELASRLFDVLTKIHAGMTELASARDRLGDEAEALRNEVAELKQAEADRIEKAAKDKPAPEAAAKK
jgi:hypothetical protein